jgi:hypothetical protein
MGSILVDVAGLVGVIHRRGLSTGPDADPDGSEAEEDDGPGEDDTALRTVSTVPRALSGGAVRRPADSRQQCGATELDVARPGGEAKPGLP